MPCVSVLSTSLLQLVELLRLIHSLDDMVLIQTGHLSQSDWNQLACLDTATGIGFQILLSMVSTVTLCQMA
jgi:hypothetical protein